MNRETDRPEDNRHKRVEEAAQALGPLSFGESQDAIADSSEIFTLPQTFEDDVKTILAANKGIVTVKLVKAFYAPSMHFPRGVSRIFINALDNLTFLKSNSPGVYSQLEQSLSSIDRDAAVVAAYEERISHTEDEPSADAIAALNVNIHKVIGASGSHKHKKVKKGKRKRRN